MRTSHHGRRPAARLALAIGGAAAFIAIAEAAHVLAVLAGGPRGTVAGVVFLGAVTGCGFALERRSRRTAELPRPAVTRLPEAAGPGEGCEPVKSAA